MSKETLPYIILKYASTLNGIIGSNNDQRLILSNQEDLSKVMGIRSKTDAILIGAGTLIKDDPQLTLRDKTLIEDRLSRGLTPQPKRVVLAKGVLLNKNLNLFKDGAAETIIFSDAIDSNLPSHIKQIIYTDHSSPLLDSLKTLKKMGVNSVLIEGGAKIISEALHLKIANEIRILYSPEHRVEGIKIKVKEDFKLNVAEKKIEQLGNQFALSIKLKKEDTHP